MGPQNEIFHYGKAEFEGDRGGEAQEGCPGGPPGARGTLWAPQLPQAQGISGGPEGAREGPGGALGGRGGAVGS